MGTHLRQQKRGHGSPAYQAPSHRFSGKTDYSNLVTYKRAEVIDLLDDVSRHPLMAKVMTDDNKNFDIIAAEGRGIGDIIGICDNNLAVGNIEKLKNLPDGTPIFNIERNPNDGGKICRSAGSSAIVVSRNEESNTVTIILRSKKELVLSGNCLATIGIANGGGRTEKPFVKAGTKHYAMHAKNRYWPKVTGTSMSAYDHPHGGRSLGKSNTVKRSTPPGRKVGSVAAKRTGRRKGND
ncbi:50S ribosomal protein L2 [uncultured archaeon]|nr:50S ribosomal protein L2 [uncultured archaeon]